MSVLRPRNRLVNFRLSEDEFDRLKTSCAIQGARSISDFARSAVMERMEQVPVAPAPSPQLDSKVADLELQLSQVLALIKATGLSVSPTTAAQEQAPLLAEAARGNS